MPGAVAEGFDRELWRRLADADLLSLLVPPVYGGAGLGPLALCLVLREAGKVLARVPLLEHSAAALGLRTFGGAGTDRLLGGDGQGASSSSRWRPTAAPATTRPNWPSPHVGTAVTGCSTGCTPPCPGPTVRIACCCFTTPVTAVPSSRSSPATPSGWVWPSQVSTNGERYAEVSLDSVRVEDTGMITAPGAWEWLRGVLVTGTCALALGLGEAVCLMTAEYTGKREQFGHPLATFQAVAIQTADRYIDLRAMEATLWQAAWRIESDAEAALPAAADIAVAKIWAAEGVRRIVQTGQHLHGGFGADTDYRLHRYHAWAKQLELSLGPAPAHEEALGELLAAHPLD
ncbi:acyl-CoA dehydrogenase family protein [Streptomyces olivoverticillatus]